MLRRGYRRGKRRVLRRGYRRGKRRILDRGKRRVLRRGYRRGKSRGGECRGDVIGEGRGEC